MKSDLETSVLEIKTSLKNLKNIASVDRMQMSFIDSVGTEAGGINLLFSSNLNNPRYSIVLCFTSLLDIPVSLPDTTDRVWSITLTKLTETKRLILQCNGVEVFNVVLSSANCPSYMWKSAWRRDVAGILFRPSDTISDYYRLVPGMGLKLVILNIALVIMSCQKRAEYS
jgi:hypothetical protein